MNTTTTPLRIAIIGSGPAGFFAADELLRKRPGTQVDLLERLPNWGGLVRYAVAPDHPITRRVMKLFEATLAKPGLTLKLGFEVGRDTTIEQLRQQYDAVVVATGAEEDRKLGIAGETLPNVIPSTAFCGWFNGDPDYANLNINLAVETAVVIGNGNVALDCARLLARSQDALTATDMSRDALATFATRTIKRIIVLGRRGPAQNSFGAAELAEFGTLADCNVTVSPAEIPEAGTAGDRLFQTLETLRGFTSRTINPAARIGIEFRFLGRPAEIVERAGAPAALGIERTRLDGDRAEGTGEYEEIPCGLVIRAAGHRGVAIAGVPFDDARGVIPNTAGRIERGLYCVGWIKRGAQGLIGHNRKDAMETAATLLADFPAAS